MQREGWDDSSDFERQVQGARSVKNPPKTNYQWLKA